MEDQATGKAALYIPLVTRERFAELSGLDEGVVRGLIEKGHLPSKKVGRYRMINLAHLNRECLEEEDYR